ncbi:hypothetical protein KKH23_09595 [Patescibacteria group bacterium]|nr:hypothetical protein [Patescibacteria group bacterium]MBU0847423.1 hypothetical protein [Patescibacteria group bacterium]
MNVLDFIRGLMPQDPWLGPPLPKLLGIIWPWLQSTEGGLPLLPLGKTDYISPSDVVTSKPALTTYENIEEIELLDVDPELLMPRRIVIHRKSKRLE